MTPMVAERSSTAMARATASDWTAPSNEGASAPLADLTAWASPFKKPPSERWGWASGTVVSSRMTSTTRAMPARARSGLVMRSSRRRMTPPMDSPVFSHASSSCAPSSNRSATESPGVSEDAEPGSSMNVA